MIPTPAEDLAAYIWPDANPEQIRLLSGALVRAFMKLEPAPEMGLRTICTKSQKNLELQKPTSIMS